ALSATSTYTGGTTVTGGQINFNALASFGTGNITLNGGGLQWASGTTSDVSPRLGALGAAGGTFDTNGNNVSLTAVLSSPRPFPKTSPVPPALSATSTYTGGTTVTGGLINFSAFASFGTGNITLNGGGLQWAGVSTLDVSSRLGALGAAGGTFDTNGNNVSLS